MSFTEGANTMSTFSRSSSSQSRSKVRGYLARSSLRPELQGIYKDGNDDRLTLRPGGAHQRQMALMQRAHGRHEAHTTDPHA